MPTRSTEVLPDVDRWIKHFEAAKQNPIHPLNPDSLDVTRWWYEFLVEVDAINEHDNVFRDLAWQ